MTLLLGLRAGEVISRVVRDLDDDGRLLWIPDAKTAKGRLQRRRASASRHELSLTGGTRISALLVIAATVLQPSRSAAVTDEVLAGRRRYLWSARTVSSAAARDAWSRA